MERFCPFGVGVDGGCHASEGGEGLVRPWSGEGDVLGREDASAESDVLGEVVGGESPCDLGGDGEAWDPEGQGPVKFVEGCGDGGYVREEFESLPRRIPEGT